MGLRVCLVTPFAWSQPHDVTTTSPASQPSCDASAIR